MPKAKKQKNGTWRCQLWLGEETLPDGKKKQIVKSFTAPTRTEAEDMASEYRRKHGRVAVANLTLSDAISRYIDSKSNILSPSTIRGYKASAEHVLAPISDVSVRKLDSVTVQQWINEQTENYAPKSLRNGMALITAACTSLDPSFTVHVTFPKAPKKEFYIPSLEEVQQLINAAQNSNIKKAIMLSAYGSLRRGELCALTKEDIDIKSNWITINKDLVENEDGQFILKPMPKTIESCRRVPVPDFVIEELKSGLITCTPNAISRAFEHTVKACKLPHIRFHDLRHFFASYLHLKGIPDAYIEKYGGWKPGSRVMKEVYRNTINTEEETQANAIRDLFSR